MRRFARSLRRRLGPSDAGYETLEVVIVTPMVLLFCGLCVVGGLIGMTHLSVDHAASAAARAASIARTPAEAQVYANRAALETLDSTPAVNCVTPNVVVNTSGFSMPVGVPSTVTATVTCTISIDALNWTGMTGTRVISGEATSPIDRLRERGR